MDLIKISNAKSTTRKRDFALFLNAEFPIIQCFSEKGRRRSISQNNVAK